VEGSRVLAGTVGGDVSADWEVVGLVGVCGEGEEGGESGG